jgi:hypothetical protein
MTLFVTKYQIPGINTPVPEGGGGMVYYFISIRLSVRPSFRPSKIFFVAFFSVTGDGRNLIFGHKLHMGTPTLFLNKLKGHLLKQPVIWLKVIKGHQTL